MSFVLCFHGAVLKDKKTPSPFVEEFPTDVDGKGSKDALPDHIYMDCMGFGMGCSCLQVCSVYCELYSVYCELYSVYCELYGVYCELYSVYCELYSVDFELYSVYCEPYSVVFELYSVCCDLYGFVGFSQMVVGNISSL